MLPRVGIRNRGNGCTIGASTRPEAMLTLTIRSSIADIDRTAEDEPLHPSTVLLVEIGDHITRVIVPDPLLEPLAQMLGAGRGVQVSGEAQSSATTVLG